MVYFFLSLITTIFTALSFLMQFFPLVEITTTNKYNLRDVTTQSNTVFDYLSIPTALLSFAFSIIALFFLLVILIRFFVQSKNEAADTVSIILSILTSMALLAFFIFVTLFKNANPNFSITVNNSEIEQKQTIQLLLYWIFSIIAFGFGLLTLATCFLTNSKESAKSQQSL